MLILSRKAGESIRIGDDIRVTVLGVQGNRVKLGFEAPDSVHIVRGELNAVTEFNQKEDGEAAPASFLLAP